MTVSVRKNHLMLMFHISHANRNTGTLLCSTPSLPTQPSLHVKMPCSLFYSQAQCFNFQMLQCIFLVAFTCNKNPNNLISLNSCIEVFLSMQSWIMFLFMYIFTYLFIYLFIRACSLDVRVGTTECRYCYLFVKAFHAIKLSANFSSDNLFGSDFKWQR